MNPIAFRRGVARDFVRWRMCGRGQGAGDRLWQDKAPKVRAVGWGPEYPRIPVLLHTLRNIPRNLRFSATRYCRSTFHTL